LDLGILPDLASQSLSQEGSVIAKLGEQLLALPPSSVNPSANDFWLKQESLEPEPRRLFSVMFASRKLSILD
jgi:hypothetical protein